VKGWRGGKQKVLKFAFATEEAVT